jgi:NAD(P)-dependent dehydrogenase (short-subunit alcohol dehydrogenase family)
MVSNVLEWSIEVNLVGAYHTARATLPRILEAVKGTVINVTSGAAHPPLQGWSAYCAGKAGLAMLTKASASMRGAGSACARRRRYRLHAAIRASGINRISQIRQIDLAVRWGTPPRRFIISAPLPLMILSAENLR